MMQLGTKPSSEYCINCTLLENAASLLGKVSQQVRNTRDPSTINDSLNPEQNPGLYYRTVKFPTDILLTTKSGNFISRYRPLYMVSDFLIVLYLNFAVDDAHRQFLVYPFKAIISLQTTYGCQFLWAQCPYLPPTWRDDLTELFLDLAMVINTTDHLHFILVGNPNLSYILQFTKVLPGAFLFLKPHAIAYGRSESMTLQKIWLIQRITGE